MIDQIDHICMEEIQKIIYVSINNRQKRKTIASCSSLEQSVASSAKIEKYLHQYYKSPLTFTLNE